MVTDEEVLQYHRATGCPVRRAKALLAKMEPLLRSRILQALQMETSGDQLLRDPIECEKGTAELVKTAAVAAETLVSNRGIKGRGSCHAIWAEQERILREQYGLVWYSPKKMNPGVRFD